MKPELYEHQKEALAFIQDKPTFALFMEQGTGKTKVIIERAEELFRANLIDGLVIIAPNQVHEQWLDEQFPMHSSLLPSEIRKYKWDGAYTIASKRLFSETLEFPGFSVFSFNVEAFQYDSVDPYIKTILEFKKCFIVIDESTRIKNGRRRLSRGKRGGAKRTNKILDLFEKTIYKAILTGTPTPRSPFDLWAQFEFLEKDFFKMDYFYFTHHHGIMIRKQNSYGQTYTSPIDVKEWSIVKNALKQIPSLTPRDLENLSCRFNLGTKDILTIAKMETYSPYKNLDRLKKDLERVTFFKKKEDCLDLPEKIYEKLYVTMSKEQQKLYKDLKQTMYAEYKGKELTVLNKMVMAIRLQMITGGLFPYTEVELNELLSSEQEAVFESHHRYLEIKESGKLQILLEDLEEVPEETSIIVWARFRGEVDMIHNALTEKGYSAQKFYGGSLMEVIEQFKNKLFQILVATQEKGGDGLNLQVSTLHYFYSNSFRADKRLQAEDRSHRIGQKQSVLYKDLIVKGTIDEHVYEVLKRKEDLINYFRTKSLEDLLK